MNKAVKIILILLILIAIIALFFVVYKNTDIFIKSELNKNNAKIDDTDQKVTEASISIVQEVKKIKQKHNSIDNQQAREIKIDNEIYELALERGDKDACFLMHNNKSRDLCIKHIALQLFDISLCQNIKDQEEKDHCLNEATLANAENNKNLSLCEEIKSEMLQLTCLERIIAQGAAVDDCEQISLRYSPRTPENNQEIELRDLCVSKVLHKQAVANGNEALCEEIPLRYIMAKCLGKLKSIPLDSDYDNDELNYYEEFIYNTDPDIADSDGDGFLDGEEVKGGYNPLGDEKLRL